MALANIKIEGAAELGLNEIVCVCGKCGHHDSSGAQIEFNFKEMRIVYLCSECKEMNEIKFGDNTPPPMPRIRVGR